MDRLCYTSPTTPNVMLLETTSLQQYGNEELVAVVLHLCTVISGKYTGQTLGYPYRAYGAHNFNTHYT